MDFQKIYQYSSGLNVLYVEDDKNIQQETVDILEGFFCDVSVADNGQEALEKYEADPKQYDLVITDINMPIMDGIKLIEHIHQIDMDQVVIVVSAHNEASRLIELIHLGISNFIMKPMAHDQLFHILYNTCKAVHNQKELIKYKDSLEVDNKSLVLELSQKNEEIMMTQQVSIEAIAEMVESYDDETGVHIRRIKSYVQTMVELLENDSDPEFQEVHDVLAFSSILHDIGKLMIPKDILTKPAKLTDEEFSIIKEHAKLGGEVLASANGVFKEKFHKDSFLKTAADIAMYHHERWDGKGYPCSLRETDIPLSARIVAVADVYDAIRSKRVYKDGMSHQKACQIIKEERAKAFDPHIVDIFLQANEKFAEIFDALK